MTMCIMSLFFCRDTWTPKTDDSTAPASRAVRVEVVIGSWTCEGRLLGRCGGLQN